jgi:hypothetical protein
MPNFSTLLKNEKITVDFEKGFGYNLIVKIYIFGGKFTMKKVLAVFLAVLMAFSALSVLALAEAPAEDDTSTTVIRYPEEDTTRDIVNDEGLVFPTNPNQLEMSFVFKIIERIINFFLGIFGSDLDQNLTESVSDMGKWLDEAISNIAGSLS